MTKSKNYQDMTTLLRDVHERLCELLADADSNGLGVREKISPEDIQEVVAKIEATLKYERPNL